MLWNIVFILVLLTLICRSQSKRIFATVWKWGSLIHNKKVRGQKSELFRQLETLKSCDPELRKEGAIRILEVGAGPGSNFEFYPKKCRLVVIEPNSFCKTMLLAKALKHPGIKIEKYIVKPAEEVTNDDIDFGKFDAVVSTLVCCSVPDPTTFYAFVKKALVPGGKYLFLDHILHPPSSIFHSVQKVLDNFKIWPTFSDGCHISRPLDKIIQQQGFKSVDSKECYVQYGFWIFKVSVLHTYGTATIR